MSVLFEKGEINGMELKNRFVRSATWEGMAADDGAVTPKFIQTMVDLADGAIGLIISSHAYVRQEGQAGPWQLGIYKDELVDGLREMTAAVHDHGGKIVAQLAHAGAFAFAKMTGLPLQVVTNTDPSSGTPAKEITATDIQELQAAFADAAARAKAAGFDGVQIHSGHGYLLSQFLSPAFNQRTDEYGGAIENRVRMHREILQAIRSATGPDYPVLIKMNSRDFIDNGLTLEDSRTAASLLAGDGIDAIELSGGVLTSKKLSPSRAGITSPEKEAYFREEAIAFRDQIDVPLILVGGMRSFEVAEDIVGGGTADFISMSRPLIREPDLVKRWATGDRRPALCKSDNLCFRPAMTGTGISCVTAEREEKRESKL